MPRRKEYLQMPTHSMPFYWQYSEGAECADSDAINTHIPLHDDATEEGSAGTTRYRDVLKLSNRTNQGFFNF